MNITTVPGVLYPPGAVTDVSTNLTSEIIASCEDPTYLGKSKLFCAENGTLYSLSGTTLTLEKTPSYRNPSAKRILEVYGIDIRKSLSINGIT